MCKCVTSGGVIDLSTVGTFPYPRFYQLKGSDTTNDTSLYSYNPCYGFDSPDPHAVVKPGTKPCKAAAACVRTPGGSNGSLPEEHSIGQQDQAKFGTSPNTNRHINYTVPGTNLLLTVILECDENKTVTDHDLIIKSPESESNIIFMTLTSKCACLNGCSASNPTPKESGLSTGSKLLIAFFTILVAYFVIGFVWNFCNGAQGLELVPNFEFWNELPKMIIDGIAFTTSCCGRKSSYGEV